MLTVLVTLPSERLQKKRLATVEISIVASLFCLY